METFKCSILEKERINFNKQAENDYGYGTIFEEETPHIASNNRHLQIIYYFIKKLPYIDARDINDYTPLHKFFVTISQEICAFIEIKSKWKLTPYFYNLRRTYSTSCCFSNWISFSC